MNYEDIVASLGECGFYQLMLMTILSLTTLQAALDLENLVFMHYTPTYYCNDFVNQSSILHKVDECYATQLNATQPPVACTNWTFDTSVMTRTLVTDFNLVCSRTYIVTIIEVLYFAGIAIGMMLGSLGDRFGRRKLILVCALWETVTSVLYPLMPHLELIILFRFMRGFSQSMYYQGLALLCELVPVQKRGIFGLNYWTFWAVGYITSSGIAYACRDWRMLRLIGCTPQVFYILFICLLPESPRWLATKNRMDEAIEVLRTMARWNGRKVKIVSFELEQKTETEDNWRMLFQLPNMRKKTLSTWLILSALAVGYSGLSIDNKFASDNLFLNVFYMGLMEIPTGVVGWLVCAKFGRRNPQIVFFLLAACSILAVPFIRHDLKISWLFSLVAIIGKFTITTTYVIADLYVAEVYPTTVRDMGMFSSCVWAQACSIIAPFVNRISDHIYFGGSLIFSLFCLVAAFLTWYVLPETRYCPLAQNLADCEKLRRGNEVEWSKEILAKQQIVLEAE